MKQQKTKLRSSKLSLTITLSAIGLLIAVTSILGGVLTSRTVSHMKNTISSKTIEMAVTAASLIDGDLVKDVEESDKGTPKYDDAFNVMKSFKTANEGVNGELAYIYGARKEDEDKYIFLMDPSEDPAEFGEELEWTYALGEAWNGRAEFDQEPFEDRWGKFYSAYAPVFSQTTGEVTMVVGIDVWADWYDSMIWENAIYIIVVTASTAAVGIALGLIINATIRRRMNAILNDVILLEEDVQQLAESIRLQNEEISNKSLKNEIDTKTGDTALLRSLVEETREEVKEYIEYAHRLANYDALCHIGNRTSYFNRINHLSTDYTVFVVDINGLKEINDQYGHNNGDEAIIYVAKVLSTIFGTEDCFRIGGDEFVVLTTLKSKEEIEILSKQIDDDLETINRTTKYDLSVSKGAASFDENIDKDFHDVFGRADGIMYFNKKKFYELRKKTAGYDRRKKRLLKEQSENSQNKSL